MAKMRHRHRAGLLGARQGLVISVSFFVVPCVYLIWRAPSLGFYLVSSDHGYQLSLGRQILLGKVPYQDLFFHYGPLTGLTSALGLWLHDSLLPETLICIFGGAAAVFLTAQITRRLTNSWAGATAGLFALMLLPRFYKWYYWLFPLLCIFLCVHLYRGAKRQCTLAFVLGMAAALGGLYRFDLGAACAVFSCVALLLPKLDPAFSRKTRTTWFFVGAMSPVMLWLVGQLAWGGVASVADAAAFFWYAVGSNLEVMSQDLPAFDWATPLSPSSATTLAYVSVVASYLACLTWGIVRARGSLDSDEQNKQLVFVVLGVAGFTLLPQAFHRKGAAHLLQVIPPAIIAAAVVWIAFWRALRLLHLSRLWHGALQVALVVLLLFWLAISWPLNGGQDLGPWQLNPVPKFRDLAAGLNAIPAHPTTRLVRAIERATGPSESILVLPRLGLSFHETQLYALIPRPMAGIFNVYYRGLFADTPWRERNVAAIRAAPPALVVVGTRFPDLPLSSELPEYQPELLAFVRTHYTVEVFRGGGWVLLARQER